MFKTVDEVICIIGDNGSGKTTTSQMLKKLLNQLGITVSLDSFAAPLKLIASKYCNYDETKKREGHRDILESLAADMRSELGDGLFAYALLDRLDPDIDVCIIDDLRFTIEADLIREFIPITIIQLPILTNPCDELSFTRFMKLINHLSINNFKVYQLNETSIETLKEFLCYSYGDLGGEE